MENNKYDKYLQYVGGVRFWIITTGVIIAFAALKATSNIVNIILLALFLTAISLAPLNWLRKRGVNKTFANLTVILSVVIVVALIGLIIGASFNGFVKKMPTYEEKFKVLWENTENTLVEYGLIDKEDLENNTLKSKNLLPMAAPLASGLGTVLSGVIIIFIFFIFMVFEAETFSKKMAYVSADSSKQTEKIIRQLRNYFGIKTLTSLATGTIIGLMLFILGVDFPVLWGFLAFILNYIPSIGSFIAAIPAVFLAFIIQGPLTGFIAVAGYLIFNTLIGNVIEPQLMGKNLGISPLIVFFSMIFFGFILGPIGMLIATPLAIIIKIIFDSREVTRKLGIMISDGKVLEELVRKKTDKE
jgi:predicted PurR-regulated permease PerM